MRSPVLNSEKFIQELFFSNLQEELHVFKESIFLRGEKDRFEIETETKKELFQKETRKREIAES